ncbi:MAG: hypothetical protein AB1941_06380 [Gemmatimonadota bacterium]
MNRWIRAAVVVLVLATAACGGTSDSPLAPAGPSYNGLLVGGNSTTTPESSDSTSTTERNGLLVGGN